MDCSLPDFLSITNSWSLLKLMSIELVMPSNHLIFCCPLLLLPLIFPSIRVFSNESVLHIRWPKYWNFSFSISPSNEYSGLISFRMDWLAYIRVHFPYLWRKGKLSSNTVVKQLFKQSWISLFPLILPLSHFFFLHCWCPWAPGTTLSNVPSLLHGLSVSLLCTCLGVFLLSFVPSLGWVYIRLRQEVIYTENNEHRSSHLAPKCLP